jgi:hypothetical protein
MSPAPGQFLCRTCRDYGLANISELEARYPVVIPVEKLAEEGVPCSCAAGVWFAEQVAKAARRDEDAAPKKAGSGV